MQLNVVLLVFLLEFFTNRRIQSVPLETYNKNRGVLLNELIRYYEPAMYVPEDVKNFHSRRRRRREVDGIPFNKPLRISFKAHDRQFNLILRTDDRLFADDVVFDSTTRSMMYDTQRVYTGFLEGEEDSFVQGVVTKDGLFDGTIFSMSEIYYVEPVSRYTPSRSQHQNSSLFAGQRSNIHTIIYKANDVKIPPSLNNPCASQILYLSGKQTEKSSDSKVIKWRRSLDEWERKYGFHGNKKKKKKRKKKKAEEEGEEASAETFHPVANLYRDSEVGTVPSDSDRIPINHISSLPVVHSHDGLVNSNILKTYSGSSWNSHDDIRLRKKTRDDFVNRIPNQGQDQVKAMNGTSNVINRPKVLTNRTQGSSSAEAKQKYDKFQGFQDMLENGTHKHLIKRATIDPKKTTCMLYLQADHLFYQKYGTEEACIEVMTRHVQRVNSIYKSTDFNQDGKSDNISFMIKRIKVHTSESSKDPSYRFPGNYGVEKFLELFSEEDYDAFCLAYMFTYRDFEMGTLGLAWTGDLKNAGGVCEKNGHYRGSLKSLNTGIVTLLNYGKHVPPAVSHVTLAHEIGHNFGSPHDPESCTPGGEDGNYIMFARATSGDKKNNNKFSPCSLNSINPVLNSKARNQMGCFTEPQVAICGNGVVEVGEDCDCGWEEDCRDSCCYPQRRYPPQGETPCKLTPNSVCSPSQGPCCTSECQLKFGDKCRDDNGCRDSSYCDGRSPSCPQSVNKPNKTICNDEFVCFMGECTGSICLAYGLESCQCIPGPKDTLTKACELCCKKPGDDQPCISSFDWNDAPFDVPDMFSKPGTPCNDYNGYCDVFQKCREVDPSGPLATLRKLLLSEESLASFKRWVTEHWYAVVVIVISIIFLMVLSTKLLGKHQDVKLKSITIIHSATTETVRLPSDGDAGLTVHPPAVRTKLPIHRKVREKKLHTKVTTRKKVKAPEEDDKSKNKSKDSSGKSSRKVEERNVTKRLSVPVQSQEPKRSAEGSKTHLNGKNLSKPKEYKLKSGEEGDKGHKTSKDKVTASDHSKAANKYQKQKSTEESVKSTSADSSAKIRSAVDQNGKRESEHVRENSKNSSNPSSPTSDDPIYEDIGGEKICLPSQEQEDRVKGSRTKRPNRVETEKNDAGKTLKTDSKNRSPVKGLSRKVGNHSKTSSPKKRKLKKEVIEYNNEESQGNVTKTGEIPLEDPLGKVQNWLMQSISMGKTSENFGIMTLTLPKSKSSPVGLSNNAGKNTEHPLKVANPPKIVHKSDKVVQIPKLTQKRSRSTGNLRKTEKKDEKVKLQVVYKPPFKFSVKLRKNRVLSAVGTKILEEKISHPNRKPVTSNTCEKMQRAAVLVRTSKRNSKQKMEKRRSSKGSPQAVVSPDKENSTENPFTFPSGVAPMSVTSVNSKQLPIYLTDQMDIDSNMHTVPSDLDVLLSESKFLFTDS